MTQEYSKAIQDLLDWNICERNIDGELKPTSDFLVWYFEYLISDIVEMYGSEWEETVDPDNMTDQQWEEIDERDKERDEFVKNAIQNQVVTWTSTKMPDGQTAARIDVDEHVNIVYSLINEIHERLMHVQSQRLGHVRKDKDDRKVEEESAKGQKKLGDF